MQSKIESREDLLTKIINSWIELIERTRFISTYFDEELKSLNEITPEISKELAECYQYLIRVDSLYETCKNKYTNDYKAIERTHNIVKSNLKELKDILNLE